LLIVVFPPAIAVSTGVLVAIAEAAALLPLLPSPPPLPPPPLLEHLLFLWCTKKCVDLIFIEYVFETRSHISTVTNHKLQIYDCESQTLVS
jgi:hypothetical protein